MKDKKQMSDNQTLKEIAETLNSENDLQVMLHEVLKKLLSLTGLHTGWIFLIDKQGKYELIADYKMPEALCVRDKQPMCEGGCWCLDRYNDGRLKRATNIIECKRIEDAIELNWGDTEGITHHATVPLRAGKEAFGLLNVASPHKVHFSDDELVLLEGVAYQIGTAIKRVTLAKKENELMLLAERNRLARDLHDSVNQLLFSLVLTARGTKEMTNEPEIKDMLSYMQQLSQDALKEMKALIWQLRPQGLENGISTALIDYAKMLGLEVHMDVNGVLNLSSHLEEALWRIAQESLNNCSKHADVKDVFITFNITNDFVVMTIQDRGHGFFYEPHKELPSLGLLSMKERAELVKGTCHIESALGKGTKVTITIPIEEGTR
ncbi:GAF domain-containing sensor histidine kinase [Metabacillus iocasae]|uniref:histidine kinase n=1 Tax=Priestia iocasae TaxID=2291674 RepID=A0ABS2QTE5_9BACI|nr:GAF domain-containing sensor histidine kinase [Metabacillus iocasae]MBM7702748.1 two-component system NarL family sensor kinase [Metabacillus iocasae]